MDFILQRVFHTEGIVEGDYTFGTLLEPGLKYKSFVLEDTYREKKIKGETRIPAGKYKLKLHKVDTPLTLKHRVDYNKNGESWFKYHIEIVGIPGYDSVYIHAGNDDKHTKGCLLLNFGFNLAVKDNQGSNSIIAVKAFYQLVEPLLEKNIDCTIDIKDEPYLKAA